MKRRLQGFVAGVLLAGLIATPAAAAGASPSVQTGDVSHVQDSSAVLHGTVNPNGSATTYYFQWGLSNSYGDTGRTLSAGHGDKAVSVQETAGNLIPGTAYHYRLVASNRYGTSVGADRTFKTGGSPPPTVATGPAANVTSTSATLTGVVNPNGAKTTWTFQYGLSPSYGVQTFGGTAGPSGSSVDVSSPLEGLEPGTVYHYRLVASHGGATTAYGADATFMTHPRRRPVPSVHATTKPHRADRRPFTFSTSGTISHPSWIPATYACSGDVAIRFMRGRHHVGFTLAGVQPNCAFGARTVFKRIPRRRGRGRTAVLTVRIRFLGNAYLAPHRARVEHVLVG